MNRYIITALYVMAGCVIAVPLKVQLGVMPSESIVKVISVVLDDEEDTQAEYQGEYAESGKREEALYTVKLLNVSVSADKTEMLYTCNQIRAPGLFC